MEKARVLIVEDQIITAKSIEAMVVDHGMEVIGICKSGEEAMEIAEKNAPDIAILDIRIQGKMTGIHLAAALQEIKQIPVIYLSDYTDKATLRKAKETHPANYLSKPFTESDLIRAIDIAITNANHAKTVKDNHEEFVFVKVGSSHSKLSYNEIIYIEADRAYCKIQTIDNLLTLPFSMATLAAQLDESRFVKIHRSYIVNIRKISEFTSTELTVSGYKLPISDQHRATLMAKLNVLH